MVCKGLLIEMHISTFRAVLTYAVVIILDEELVTIASSIGFRIIFFWRSMNIRSCSCVFVLT